MRLELLYAAPGQTTGARFQLGEPTLMVGSLTSNQIVLAAPGVEPIHCLIEPVEAQSGVPSAWRVVDLGTLVGVKINGRRIEVEATLTVGDTLTIGGATLTLREVAAAAAEARGALPAAELPLAAGFGAGAATPPAKGRSRLGGRILFSPRRSRLAAPSGRLLEVVAYWGDTILNVDHFHPDLKGFDSVTIGDPTKAHFLSGGKEFFKSRVLADVESGRCVLRLTSDMRARVSRRGEVETVDGSDLLLALEPRDFAHVEYGPIQYFLHFANPPHVDLPRLGRVDRLLGGLSLAAFVAYVALVVVALTTKPAEVVPPAVVDEPIWQLVSSPRQDHKPHAVPVHEVHVVLPPTHPASPAAPRHEPAHPVPPPHSIARASLQRPSPQPVQAPVQTPPSQVEQHHAQVPTPTPVQSPSAVQSPAQRPATASQDARSHAAAPGAGARAPTQGANGRSGAPAGDKRPAPARGNTGGPGQHNALSDALKGHQSFNNMGVEGGNKPSPSTPDLRTLKNLGVGLVMDRTGGIHTDLTSGGTMGIKSGTLSHDHGMGTVGQGQSLDLPGSSGQIGSWSTGPGGVVGAGGPGAGGVFGHGPGGPGAGLGEGPGGGPGGLTIGSSLGAHKNASVVLPPPMDPVADGQYNPDWILQVIRQHLNEIRHCYEQTLQYAPHTAGRLKAGFVIGANGRVTSVSVLNTDLSDMRMRGCVTGKIQRWAFPRPPSGSPVTVTYPFIFTPVN